MGDATDRSKEIARLRERAAELRRLAKQHGEAGNAVIAQKLSAVTAELEAKADQLDGLSTPHSPRTP